MEPCREGRGKNSRGTRRKRIERESWRGERVEEKGGERGGERREREDGEGGEGEMVREE